MDDHDLNINMEMAQALENMLDAIVIIISPLAVILAIKWMLTRKKKGHWLRLEAPQKNEKDLTL